MIFFSGLINQPAILLGFLLGITIAITIHEYSHAWSANRFGDPTAKNMGRLTLNPLAHFDPVGTIFLFLAGFGWGKPVPINPNNFANKKWDQLWVSLSGPASNLLAAFILALPYRYFVLTNSDLTLLNSSFVGTLLNVTVEINIILAVFNLLPIPPLDGAEIVSILLPAPLLVIYNQFGPLILFTLLALEFLPTNLNLFSAIFTPVITTLLYIVRAYPFG